MGAGGWWGEGVGEERQNTVIIEGRNGEERQNSHC